MKQSKHGVKLIVKLKSLKYKKAYPTFYSSTLFAKSFLLPML